MTEVIYCLGDSATGPALCICTHNIPGSYCEQRRAFQTISSITDAFCRSIYIQVSSLKEIKDLNALVAIMALLVTFPMGNIIRFPLPTWAGKWGTSKNKVLVKRQTSFIEL